MKLINIIIYSIILFTILLSGCGIKYPELSEGSIGFETANYTDENTNEGYLIVEYNGRTYLPYWIQKGTIKEKYIDKLHLLVINQIKNESTFKCFFHTIN